MDKRMKTYYKGIASFIILFAILLAPNKLSTQTPYFVNYDIEDGLPSSEVYDVEVDSNGVIWFATDRGLSSFNGYEFETYTTEDGLANNTILKIWNDPSGNYWLPGLDGSLTIYDHENLYPYKWNDSITSRIHRPANIAFDDFNKLYFWRIGLVFDLFSVNDESGEVTIESFDELTDKYPYFIKDSSIFVNINGYYIPGNEINYSGPNIIDTDKFHFFFYKANQLDEKEKTLFKRDKSTETIDSFKFEHQILNQYWEPDGHILVGTKKGLYRFKNGDLKVSPDYFFKESEVSDMAIDKEGNYWITTQQNGVFKIPTFEIYTIRTPINNYSSEKILSIAKLENHIFFGSSDGSLFVVNDQFECNELKEQNIGEQHWYASTHKNKAYFKGLQITEVGDKLQFHKIHSSYTFPGLSPLKNGQIFGLGFFEVRILSPDFNREYYPSEYSFKKRIVCIVEQENKIWMGTPDGLYSIIDYDYDNIVNESKSDSLLNVRINDMKIDHYENLWLATIGNGLIYKTADTLFQINMNNGLKSNHANHLFVENDSSVWIATTNGLSHLIYSFDKDNFYQKKLSSYTTIDGLLSNYINSVTKWKDNIWAATNKGICYFSPEELQQKNIDPIIILEEVIVNQENVDLSLTNSYKFNQNDWYFKFTGISFRKVEDQPFYRYRLISEITDSTWYYTNNRDVRFNDLKAGTYIFEAAAQNKYGQWSENPILYRFTINPHFTQTWWFRGLLFLILIGIVFLVFQTRSQRIKFKEEQKRKLQEAELKTKDAELQALRNQMNPHFVFNALNSIQNFVFKNDAKKANYYLSRFSKLMRDGLQFARLKYISLKEEIIFLNTYLELEKMRFPNKFQYKVVVEEDIPTNQYFIPPLLFQPILENAVKHAFKNIEYEGLLEIHFEENIPGELLKITILDNGEGFDLESVNKTTKSKNKSLGLEIIKNQIALLNSEGKDSKASFRIFNRKTLDPQQSGTQAEFVLSIKFSEDDQGSHH